MNIVLLSWYCDAIINPFKVSKPPTAVDGSVLPAPTFHKVLIQLSVGVPCLVKIVFFSVLPRAHVASHHSADSSRILRIATPIFTRSLHSARGKMSRKEILIKCPVCKTFDTPAHPIRVVRTLHNSVALTVLRGFCSHRRQD